MVALICSAGQAATDGAERQFDIRSPELARALLAFAEQSELVVIADAESLVAGKPAPEVTGTMPPDEAIERLLQGSGLRYERSADGTMRIAPARQRQRHSRPAAAKPMR